jgi:hypothetical protein
MFGDQDNQVGDMGSVLFGNHSSINEWTDDSESELLDNLDSGDWVDLGDDLGDDRGDAICDDGIVKDVFYDKELIMNDVFIQPRRFRLDTAGNLEEDYGENDDEVISSPRSRLDTAGNLEYV